VTDPEARFTATVLLRVQTADPAAISAIARILSWPYLKVTRIRFLADEFVEVTNLGGGEQDLTGWQLRAGAQGRSFSLPTGVVLGPGERCTLYNGPALNPGVHSGIFGGTCEATTATTRYQAQGWWPNAGGTVELYDSALALVADATVYDADPNRQPPPPNLQLVDAMSCPDQPPAPVVAQPGARQPPPTPPRGFPPTTQPGGGSYRRPRRQRFHGFHRVLHPTCRCVPHLPPRHPARMCPCRPSPRTARPAPMGPKGKCLRRLFEGLYQRSQG